MIHLRADSVEEVIQAVRAHQAVLPHGALTKAPLAWGSDGVCRLDMRNVSGLIEYQPEEFTFTACAGTAVRDIEAALSEHGQYLPFDPPLAGQGATLGGMVAAGLNGSGRLRFGGLRDFVIGVQIVDGTARLVRGGGRVVKNAAGFDLPKLMVGSMGRLGIITELSFKVFPRPGAWRSVRVTCRDLADAMLLMADLGGRPLDIEAMDLEPPSIVVLRVGGEEPALADHVNRIAALTGRRCQVFDGDEEQRYWDEQRGFAWVPPDHLLVKGALIPRRVPAVEEVFARSTAPPRRYAVAGNVAWVAWPADRPIDELPLAGMRGLVVRGPAPAVRLGDAADPAKSFARAVKSALDPQSRFGALI